MLFKLCCFKCSVASAVACTRTFTHDIGLTSAHQLKWLTTIHIKRQREKGTALTYKFQRRNMCNRWLDWTAIWTTFVVHFNKWTTNSHLCKTKKSIRTNQIIYQGNLTAATCLSVDRELLWSLYWSLLTMSSLDMTFEGLVSSMRLAVASSSLPSTSPPAWNGILYHKSIVKKKTKSKLLNQCTELKDCSQAKSRA